jgi:hypothetical protein
MDGIVAVWQLRMAKADQFGLWPQNAADAGRFVVEADQELPAFLELESAIEPIGIIMSTIAPHRINNREINADHVSKAG